MQGDKSHPEPKAVCENFVAKGLTLTRKAEQEGELQAGNPFKVTPQGHRAAVKVSPLARTAVSPERPSDTKLVSSQLQWRGMRP